MKKIDVTVKPFELDEIREAVCALGIQGMTITEIKVPREPEKHGGMFNSLEFIPKIKIEIVVSDSAYLKTVDTIDNIINNGRDSSDNILVSHIDDAVRIRTLQKGEDAIT